MAGTHRSPMQQTMANDIDEYQTLQQMLEANQIYDPRMSIDEMRALCEMIEKSELEPQPEVGVDAVPPKKDNIDIVEKLFENHKIKLQQCENHMQGIVNLDESSPPAADEGTSNVPEKMPIVVQQCPDENEKKEHGRRWRSRGHRRNQPNKTAQTEMRKKQQKQDDEEYRQLRCFLEERDLYKPPMDIEEMREVCQAIEQSMQDMNLEPREPEFENWTYLIDYRQQEQLREDNWQPPSDLNPIFVDYINNDQIDSALSPPIVPGTKTKSPELLESPPEWSPSPAEESHMMTLSVPVDVDSDSETEYSPDNPGPCCKVIHLIQAEVHPIPREDCPDESPQKSCAKLNRSLLSRTVPTDAWDAIDEFF